MYRHSGRVTECLSPVEVHWRGLRAHALGGRFAQLLNSGTQSIRPIGAPGGIRTPFGVNKGIQRYVVLRMINV